MSYTFKKQLANKSNYGEKRDLSTIKYLVLHYTSNDGDTDENNGKYFANNIVNASAHYFVDDDSVTQSVPDDYVAWSVGGKKYNDCATTGGGKLYGKATNANTLSIEICDDVKNGVVYPSAATIENAIAFTKAKQKEYNIPDSNVIRHFDVNGKKCPAYWVDDAKWKSEFWNKLTEPAKDDVMYRVQVGAYKVKANADAQMKKVKAAGFDTYMVQVDGMYKIQVGAYSKKENADAMLAKVKAAGFSAFITTKGGTGVASEPKVETTAPVVKKEIKVGSTVKVKKGAKTYQGGNLASFVYERNHKVKQINVDRVVITYNGVVVAAVRKSDLTLID